MKVFHIVEEFSKKNNSIISITQILSGYKNFNDSRIIIPSSNKKFLNADPKIEKIEIFKNLFKFKSKIYEFLNINQPDLIHIHGLWRPIHILFIFVSRQLNIPLIIQPHGMLLDEAIKTKSVFTYFLKLLIIGIYKLLLKEAIFIAVTDEEKKSIFKYFKTKNIIVIPNPFESTFKIHHQRKKNISYFGRFSSHKNIDLIIDSFLEANLSKEWKLMIYGIDDDDSYKQKIIEKINKSKVNKRIFIKKPIFEKKEKFKTMSENFLNILMSKSEILSLSVLEGLSVGTRSLVNNQIKYPKKISKLLHFTDPKKKNIAKKMNMIIKDFPELYSTRNLIKNKFNSVYDIKFSENKYTGLVRSINQIKRNIEDVNFFNISIANGLNSFFVPFLVVIYVLINPNISAEIGIIEGTVIYITQIFSSNSRAILLNEKKEDLFFKFISFRLLLSILIFSLFIFFFSGIGFIEEDFHRYLIPLILISWINEITLTLLEKNKLRIFIKLFIYFTIFFYFLITLNILNESLYFKNIISAYFLFHFIFLNYFFYIRKVLNFNLKFPFFYENIYPFLSTFSNITSVLFWRYSILFYCSKDIAGIIFSIFSIASFPGTFYNNILGQTVLRQKKIDNFFLKYEKVFYISFFVLIILNYLFLKNTNIFQINDFIINTLTLSFLGTLVMIISLRKRHRSLFKFFYKKNKIFRRDILYSLLIFPIIIILFNSTGLQGVSFAYLISAIISYIIYSKNYGKNS